MRVARWPFTDKSTRSWASPRRIRSSLHQNVQRQACVHLRRRVPRQLRLVVESLRFLIHQLRARRQRLGITRSLGCYRRRCPRRTLEHRLQGFRQIHQLLPNRFLDPPQRYLFRELMLREVPELRHRCRHRPKFQGKEGHILRPQRQRLTQQEIFGDQLGDTIWGVSQF